MALGVDLVQPNLLLSTRRVRACAQDRLHLRNRGEEDVPSNEPPDTLSTRWTGQTALVGPKLIERIDLIQRQRRVELNRLLEARLVEADYGRQLPEEARVRVTWINTECQNGALVALCVDVHQVQLSLRPVTLDGVVGRSMNVPAAEVDGLVHSVVVEDEARKPGPVALGVLEREGGPVAPVVEVAACGFGVLKVGPVGEGKPLREEETDRRLLGASLT